MATRADRDLLVPKTGGVVLAHVDRLLAQGRQRFAPIDELRAEPKFEAVGEQPAHAHMKRHGEELGRIEDVSRPSLPDAHGVEWQVVGVSAQALRPACQRRP